MTWSSYILISTHQKEMSGLCGFHVVSLMWFFLPASVFFTAAFSGCLNFRHGLSFFLRETPQGQFRDVPFVFRTPEEWLFPDRSREPIPPAQLDQHIRLHLVRITPGDLHDIFALNKTANAILGVRRRHRKDNTFL